MENLVLISLTHFSKLLGLKQLFLVKHVRLVSQNVNVVLSGLSTEQMVYMGDSWPLVILVKVLHLTLYSVY